MGVSITFYAVDADGQVLRFLTGKRTGEDYPKAAHRYGDEGEKSIDARRCLLFWRDTDGMAFERADEDAIRPLHIDELPPLLARRIRSVSLPFRIEEHDFLWCRDLAGADDRPNSLSGPKAAKKKAAPKPAPLAPHDPSALDDFDITVTPEGIRAYFAANVDTYLAKVPNERRPKWRTSATLLDHLAATFAGLPELTGQVATLRWVVPDASVISAKETALFLGISADQVQWLAAEADETLKTAAAAVAE